MPPAAFALALLAAFLHAAWNLVVARSSDPLAATAVALVVGVVALAPLALLGAGVAPAALPVAAASSALELLYFALLAAAYGTVALSAVYPVARGLAPVLVLAGAVLLLGGHVAPGQMFGVVLVGAGVLLVRGFRSDRSPRSFGLGLVIAAVIATYTLLDKEGVRHATPLAYLELVLLAPAILFPGLIAARRGLRPLADQLRPATFLGGVAMVAAYGVALAALQLGSAPAVSALRETSIVIATLGAGPLLGERVDAHRLLGSVVVASGAALIALA